MGEFIKSSVWKKMSSEQQAAHIAKRASGKASGNNAKKKRGKVVKNGKKAPKVGKRKMLGVPSRGSNRQTMTVASNLLPSQDPRVQITAVFNIESYRNVYVSLISYLVQKGVVNVDTEQFPHQWITIYDSITYLLQTGSENFIGSTVTVNNVPRALDNLYQALLAKKIRFGGGFMAYGFQSFMTALAGLSLNFGIYGKQYNTTFIDSDGGGAAELANVYLGANIPDNYTAFLSIINNLDPNGMLETVEFKKSDIFTRNVSGYSRGYSFVGNQPAENLGGFWLDKELEVPIQTPIFAQFVTYDTNPAATDPRIPRHLVPWAGDSLQVVGWPLHPSFPGYINKTPPVIQQVDADEVFIVLSLWMAKLKLKAAERGVPLALNALPFSQQSLYLVMRSALLEFYDTQYFTQFSGNNQWIGTANNAFLGFFVMGHCAGNTNFGRMNIPQLLAENLAAMKARTIGKEGSANPTVYYPNVGRWYQDTLPIFQIVDPNTGTSLGPLYSVVPGEPVIDFIDCTVSGKPVNVIGSYYQTVMADWNEAVNEFKDESMTVQPMMNDAGPKGLLIAMSNRLINNIDAESSVAKKKDKVPVVPQRISNSLRFLSNGKYDVIKENGMNKIVPKKQDPKVGALLPANILDFATVDVVCRFPVTSEAYELFNVIILPKNRLDPTNDVFNKQIMQVAGKMPFSYAENVTTNGIVGTGMGEWDRLNQFANEMITGFAREGTTKFQEIWKKLIIDGKGGALGSLLGGVGKAIFPGNDALIDGIESFFPF